MMEALAVSAPLVLASEKGLFHLPQAEEVRVQTISKEDNERSWPFSVDSGKLTCVWSMGQKIVFFFESPPDSVDDEDFEPRGVLVTANPIDLTIGNMANRDLFAPMASVAELISRVAPYEQLGQHLCDQPPGAVIGHGEL
jgi:hypothetical protein